LSLLKVSFDIVICFKLCFKFKAKDMIFNYLPNLLGPSPRLNKPMPV
jgi:hypothetical protein